MAARELWECDECGCGECCAPGVPPDPPEHRVYDRATNTPDGKVCGTYVFVGPCDCCEYEREKA